MDTIQKVSLIEKLREVQKKGTALWATNFYNLETLKGILLAAAEANQAIILQMTRSSIKYMGLKTAVAMARALAEELSVRAWLHLDHGDTVDLVRQCLDNGFDSVMIDGSELPLDKNIEVTSRVVELAANYGAAVEAELGYVAKLGQSTEKVGFTEPADAARFVAETGVHALAIAIGSAHGFYKKSPHLDMGRLREIHAAVDIPLVLHGSSGIPADQLLQAVQNGICKINLATEIKNAFTTTLRKELLSNEEIDLRKIFPPATEQVKNLVLQKLTMISGAQEA